MQSMECGVWSGVVLALLVAWVGGQVGCGIRTGGSVMSNVFLTIGTVIAQVVPQIAQLNFQWTKVSMCALYRRGANQFSHPSQVDTGHLCGFVSPLCTRR